jgi:hypothetical protein
MTKRTIRATQLVSPFGPGAVVDLGGESFACTDITMWPRGECPVVPGNPLEDILGVQVRSPPNATRGAAVPLSRFPRWYFCPICRRLYHINETQDRAAGSDHPVCEERECDKAALNPMRFVVACDQGHLSDVDWHRWAHRNQQTSSTGQCSFQTMRLVFETTGASGGDFNSMRIRCTRCGVQNSLEGLTTGPYAFRCGGKQPWQSAQDRVECTARARVFPRAASSVYFPEVRSAIDLATDEAGGGVDEISEYRAWVKRNPLFGALVSLRKVMGGSLPEAMYREMAQEGMRKFGISEEVALEGIRDAVANDGPAVKVEGPPATDKSQHGILRAEWPQVSRRTPVKAKHFRTRIPDLAEDWPSSYRNLIEQVTLVDRLREVRALLGFRRVRPDSSSAFIAADLGSAQGWLPGVATFGEGIFLRFNEQLVASWERGVEDEFEARRLELATACDRWGRTPAELHASPRFIALHTFAHGIIRRLAFDAGYSSASIRERIYCDTGASPAAGILIYTAEGDSEGSLGGLVRQGTPSRLLNTLERTIADLRWCSGDPVCAELEGQGVDGMNSAACHACCLLAETSCAYSNSLLDRRLLIGSGQIKGLLSALMEGN